MKMRLPEYLLCEDPTTEKENLFIYHVATKSLVHIFHTDNYPPNEAEIKYINRRYFDYTYKSNTGALQKIVFVAEIVDSSNAAEQLVLEQCAHWYACYLGWEDERGDVLHKQNQI